MTIIDKHRVAAFLRRVPWAGYVAQRIWRIGQSWMTAGAVGAVFNQAGQLLLVKHVYHPRYPWGLPGGWVARGEDPDETVRREVYEETSLRVQIIRPLLIARTPYLPRHLDIAYLCHAPPDAGEIRLSPELLDYCWSDPTAAVQRTALTAFHRRTIEAALAERQMNLADPR